MPEIVPGTSITDLIIGQMVNEDGMNSAGTSRQLDLFAQLYL